MFISYIFIFKIFIILTVTSSISDMHTPSFNHFFFIASILLSRMRAFSQSTLTALGHDGHEQQRGRYMNVHDQHISAMAQNKNTVHQHKFIYLFIFFTIIVHYITTFFLPIDN